MKKDHKFKIRVGLWWLMSLKVMFISSLVIVAASVVEISCGKDR